LDDGREKACFFLPSFYAPDAQNAQAIMPGRFSKATTMNVMLRLERPHYWLGTPPMACDGCEKPIETTFIDGQTRGAGWAKLCLCCHRQVGEGIGRGVGQLYRIQPDGRWMKTEG
jgi:hypothetical protein